MMMNLFSIFDPSSKSILNLTWMSLFIPPIVLMYSTWIMNSPNIFSIISLKVYIKKEFKPNFQNNSYYQIILFIIMFYVISIINSYGLLPYIFTSTAHMMLTLPLGFLIWMSIIMYMWIKSPMNSFAHLLPKGTPFPLLIFMILIETVSMLIRPLTLAIRLMANMTAGHMILCLISSLMPSISILSFIFFTPQIILMILEMAVAVIQAYVFSILLTLYFSESK